MGADKQSITFWRWHRITKIITTWGYRFVAPSSSWRRIRQKFDPARCFVISRSPNPSKYVKICQNMSIFVFWRYMQNDRFVICHFSSFTLAVWERVVCSGGAWFAETAARAWARFSACTVAIKSSSLPSGHCHYHSQLQACTGEQMWIIFLSSFPCRIDSDVIVFSIIQKTKDPWCYVHLNLSPI